MKTERGYSFFYLVCLMISVMNITQTGSGLGWFAAGYATAMLVRSLEEV